MSKVLALYHIVFCTKRREMTITEAHKRDLYRYINIIIKERKSVALRINGIGNHIHMLVSLHPATTLSDLVRDIKRITSDVLSNDPRFPHFNRWAKEYYAASVSPSAKDAVIEYIKGQEVHHGVESLEDEMLRISQRDGIGLHVNDMYE